MSLHSAFHIVTFFNSNAQKFMLDYAQLEMSQSANELLAEMESTNIFYLLIKQFSD